jgi:hypothetical protein
MDRAHPGREGVDIGLVDLHARRLKLFQRLHFDLGGQGESDGHGRGGAPRTSAALKSARNSGVTLDPLDVKAAIVGRAVLGEECRAGTVQPPPTLSHALR